MNQVKIEQIPHILIVDDDPLSIFIAERILKKDFNYESVQSGQAALSIVENQKFDLILMDINLGDINMDGIRTMKIIRQLAAYRYTPIFALTAFSHNKPWYIDQGFDELFIKPLTSDIVKVINDKLFHSLKRKVIL
ncbi:MAG: sensor hybrid histidine kinase [Bacteroidetes bacterium]|nr:sensor hybrid histidine kinase [Bacteroidota bacterium]